MPFLVISLLVGHIRVLEPLDQYAQQRNLAQVQSLATAALLKEKPQVFNFVKQNGSYGVGRFGWHAYELEDPVDHSRYAVFSTPLTCEDMGEQEFAWANGKLTRYVPEAEDFGVKVRDHDMKVHFNLAKQVADFTDEASFERTSEGRSFQFRLSDHFVVSSITDANGRPVPFSQAGGVVAVKSPAVNQFRLKIAYAGVVNLPQYAGSVTPDEVILAQDYWYPIVGRGAAPYTLTSWTPKGWSVIGQGRRVSQSDSGAEVVTKFRMDLPTVYYSFSAAPFKSATDKIGNFTYTTYSKDATEAGLHEENMLQSAVIDFYNRTFAPYPFPAWETVGSRLYGGGALEAYSYASYGGGIPSEDPHEPSHTWWGGIMPNSYLHSQWNESFADFSEGLFHRSRPLGNTEEREKAFIQDSMPQELFKAAVVAEGPGEIGEAAGLLGYDKGAKVLQMLEDELGTEMMLKCMRNWIHSHVPGTLEEWSGFEAAVKRTTGKDYGWFFSQWLHRTGWPTFEISNVRVGGADSVSVAPVAGWLPEAGGLPHPVLLRSTQGHRPLPQGEVINASDLQAMARLCGSSTLTDRVRWSSTSPLLAGEVGEPQANRVRESRDFKEYLAFSNVRAPEDTRHHTQDIPLTADIAWTGEPYQLRVEVLLQYADGSRETRAVELMPDQKQLTLNLPKRPVLVSFDPWRRLLRTYHPDEAPPSLSSVLPTAKRYTSSSASSWLPNYFNQNPISQLLDDLNGTFIVGSPQDSPVIADLCKKVGFEVSDGKLTYQGTTINLQKGAALAVVDLPNGGHCVLGLGTTKLGPNFGRARLCLVDQYGRFLRGVSEPKTSGWMTFRL
jgi:hypothetical protein